MSCFICRGEDAPKLCKNPTCVSTIHHKCLAQYREHFFTNGKQAKCACTHYFDSLPLVLAIYFNGTFSAIFMVTCVYSFVKAMIEGEFLVAFCCVAAFRANPWWISYFMKSNRRLLCLAIDQPRACLSHLFVSTVCFYLLGDEYYMALYRPKFVDFFWQLYHFGAKWTVSTWLSSKLLME